VLDLGPQNSFLFSRPNQNLYDSVVFYMKTNKGTDISLPQFPVWVEVGYSLAEHWYGLPQFGAPGFKIARHRLTGPSNHPDKKPEILDIHRREAINKTRERIPSATGIILREEHCIYTMRSNEDYLIDSLSSKTIVASGFSGHGFKLAPLCGDRIVDIVEGKQASRQFLLQPSHTKR
jgi:glycine/D-amino acid oxidase-like deaminating enzyme